ncbi:MAG: HAD-IA family hydrolase [Alphaproteobacteria bacterium]
MANQQIKAVLWDFGGVITSSPFEAFNRMEEQKGLPKDFVRSINSVNPDTNAWAQFERSDISAEVFDTLFAEEARAKGGDVTGAEVIACLAGAVRPEMVKALSIVKSHYKTACITNNVKAGSGAGMARSEDVASEISTLMDTYFDHVVESSKVEIRKPDPRIYQMTCEAIGVEPSACVYLDDLGINLKPARAMGMQTIKVLGAEQAISELEAILELSLR